VSEWTGTIVAKSENGIKVKENGEWLNWTKPEWRGQPFNTDVRAGDRVRIEYATVDNKTYISVIENLSRPHESSAPFPPEDEFPGGGGDDRAFPTDAGRESVEAPGDRQTSIVRQTCIKAASVALQHGMGTPEEKAGGILYLAGELENWVNR
jgi:hypothetical protein